VQQRGVEGQSGVADRAVRDHLARAIVQSRVVGHSTPRQAAHRSTALGDSCARVPGWALNLAANCTTLCACECVTEIRWAPQLQAIVHLCRHALAERGCTTGRMLQWFLCQTALVWPWGSIPASDFLSLEIAPVQRYCHEKAATNEPESLVMLCAYG